MIDVAHLLNEQTLRGAEVEVGSLTIEELARDTSDGDDSHIGHAGLSRQLVCRELLLCRQRARHEAGQHGSLLILLGHLFDLLLASLLTVCDILLVGGLQFVADSVATILQTIEQRDDIGVVHITRTCATSDEVVRGAAIEGHILHALLEGQSLSILHEHHTLGSTLTGDGSMTHEVGLVGILITLESGTLLHEVQDALYVTVEVGLVELAALHTSHDRVELLLLTRLQHVVTSPHL